MLGSTGFPWRKGMHLFSPRCRKRKVQNFRGFRQSVSINLYNAVKYQFAVDTLLTLKKYAKKTLNDRIHERED